MVFYWSELDPETYQRYQKLQERKEKLQFRLNLINASQTMLIKALQDQLSKFKKILSEPQFGTFHAIAEYDNYCTECNGNVIIDGWFATDEKLRSGYTPSPFELIKNNVMRCQKCGAIQGS